MAAEYIQAKLGYRFAKPESLNVAVKAAHSSDIDGTSDDGNRGLAVFGTRAFEMTEAYHMIIVEERTKRDANLRNNNHWFKSKKTRAAVCKELGIDQYVVKSIRQGCRAPSTEVLANVLSAIIGALWLDLQTQNGNFEIMVEQTYRILRRIEATVARWEIVGTPLTPVSIVENIKTPPSQIEMTQKELGRVSDHYISVFNEQSQECENPPYNPLQPHAATTNIDELDIYEFWEESDFLCFDPGATRNLWHSIGCADMDEITQVQEPELSLDIEEVASAGNDPIVDDNYPEPGTKSKKRKSRDQKVEWNDEKEFHKHLIQAELEKLSRIQSPNQNNMSELLDHIEISRLELGSSHETRLRLLYLTIGSGQPLNQFRNILHTARNRPDSSLSLGADLHPQARYQKILGLERQEALCVLQKRYHTVALFKSIEAKLFQAGALVLQTPSTFMEGRVEGVPGNPLNKAKADITDKVLEMLLSEPANGSQQYAKARRNVDKLRRLAKILALWTDAYGLGILALLPSGSTISDFTLTDNMLYIMGEKRVKSFSEIMYRHQGEYLKQLSKAMEPALIALVEGTLAFSALFSIEVVDENLLETLPKGYALGYLV